ncbi:LuxR C-terminal-related transcriptional regulator [Chitinibacter sp. S2-10]|uniref:LuxR C-terminal-related transcriptional regulator n=1 Tax=Chitinibacter sp. S2-10 TaxID=3373597 RepID=UPI003977B6E4
MDTKIKVILICDLPMVAWGLQTLINAQTLLMEVIACVDHPAHVSQLINADQTYVILLDLDGDHGIEAISALLSGANVRVLVIAAANDTDQQDKAVLAGACGAISKREPVEVLLKAIQKVNAGEYWVDRAATERILMTIAREKGANNAEHEKIARLTRKEKQTIAAIALGSNVSTLEIAERLHISEHTLRNHLTSIYAKLGVHNRMGLYAYAQKYGLTQ